MAAETIELAGTPGQLLGAVRDEPTEPKGNVLVIHENRGP